jgi:hypothetical protein
MFGNRLLPGYAREARLALNAAATLAAIVFVGVMAWRQCRRVDERSTGGLRLQLSIRRLQSVG